MADSPAVIMNDVNILTQEVTVTPAGSYDIVVVGGGIAGCAAICTREGLADQDISAERIRQRLAEVGVMLDANKEK